MNSTAPTILLSISVALGLAACGSTGSDAEPSAARGPNWSIAADVAESCCCDAICPCMVGSPATRGHCEGTRLIDIHHGRFGDVDLDGIAVLATFRMGDWVKLYVSDESTPEQSRAAEQLIAAALPSFAGWGIVSTERVPVSIERNATWLAYSCPASSVEIDVMAGRDGEPIRVENLAAFPDYVQYVSRTNRHRSAEHNFEYSGTNGFTATFAAGG